METLKEFRNILLGHQITVYTDHKNLTYKCFNTECVMRWRLIIEMSRELISSIENVKISLLGTVQPFSVVYMLYIVFNGRNVE